MAHNTPPPSLRAFDGFLLPFLLCLFMPQLYGSFKTQLYPTAAVVNCLSLRCLLPPAGSHRRWYLWKGIQCCFFNARPLCCLTSFQVPAARLHLAPIFFPICKQTQRLAGIPRGQTATFQEVWVSVSICRTRYPARYRHLDFHPFSVSIRLRASQGSLCEWIFNSLFSKVDSVEKLLLYLVLQIIIASKTCLEIVFFQHIFLALLLSPRLNHRWLKAECSPACRHCSSNFICLVYLL